MARVKSLAQRKHRKLRAATKGFKQARRRRVKAGREALLHAGQYAFAGRRIRRRDLRRTWITRINSGLTPLGVKYSVFISALKKSNIELDRKILSELATSQPEAFKEVVRSSGLKI